jgi:hypothetical protein
LVTGNVLELKDRAADRHVRIQGLELVPTLWAAVRGPPFREDRSLSPSISMYRTCQSRARRPPAAHQDSPLSCSSNQAVMFSTTSA